MTQITAVECYSTFHAIKWHFEGKYDYAKYHGKFSITENTLKNTRDQSAYISLAKKFNAEDFKDLAISNVLRKPDIYARELLSEESRETMIEYQKRVQALSYNFSSDIDHLKDVCEKENCKLEDLFVVREGQAPILLKQYEWRVISLETLIILDRLLGFFGYWNKRIRDKLIWPSIYQKCAKYSTFLTYDTDVYHKILREKLNGH